jgi:MYXO-CTERM domain-containing protein
VARQSYPAQTFALPAGVDAVENNHGNPARFWGTTNWSIATDSAVNPGGFGYPGGNGAGSDTGMTQRGGGGDWSIEYGLRDVFVVQSDFVQLPDRVDFTIGATASNIFGAGNISIFFRTTGHPSFPEIGIFNGAVETNTGLTSTIPVANAWNNYALLVNVPNDTIEVFVNEVSRGVIDLNTIGGGAYNDILNNGFVGSGGAGADRLWSDNFQVGGDIPEPAPAMLGLLGLGFLLRRSRR